MLLYKTKGNKMLLIYTSLGKQDKVQIPQVDTKINNVLYCILEKSCTLMSIGIN